MAEIRIMAGKHKCGKNMDMRIADVKDDEKNIISWIIYGVCKKCSTVLISNLFLQSDRPLQDRDFIVDYTKISDDNGEKNL